MKTIKHLVCSSGAFFGFTAYGFLKESYNQKLWKFKDIQTVYGSSVGSIILLGIIISLKNENVNNDNNSNATDNTNNTDNTDNNNINDECWNMLDKYLINRPWHNIFDLSITNILNSFYKCGILSFDAFEEIFRPLFEAHDLNMKITWKELYEKIPIEMHVFTVQLHTLTCVDISHKTHPDWLVLESIYMSSAMPILFSPFTKDKIIYTDGGIIKNYPIYDCIENGANIDEILGIRKIEDSTQCDKAPETMLDYIYEIISQLLYKVTPPVNVHILYECKIVFETMTIQNIHETTTVKEKRRQLIKNGVDMYYSFIQNIPSE